MDDAVFLPLACALLVTVSVVGFLGNCLVFHAVLRHKKRQLNDFLILNLSLTDFGACVISIPLDLVQMFTKNFPFGKALCHVVYPFQSVLLYVSVMTLLFMSWERYRLIVTPMKEKITVKIGLVVIAMTWLLSILIVLPYALSLKLVESDCTEAWPSVVSKKVFTLGVFVFLYAIPLVIIAMLYACVVRVLYTDTKKLSSTQPPSASQGLVLSDEMTTERIERNVAIVKIFVAAVVAFAVCMLPTHVSWLWHDFGGGQDNEHFREIVTFSNVVMYSNSLINPFIFGSLRLGPLVVKLMAFCRAVEESTSEKVFVMRSHFMAKTSHNRREIIEQGGLNSRETRLMFMRAESSV